MQDKAVQFGEWLLKHCQPIFHEGRLRWKYGEAIMETAELLEVAKKYFV